MTAPPRVGEATLSPMASTALSRQFLDHPAADQFFARDPLGFGQSFNRFRFQRLQGVIKGRVIKGSLPFLTAVIMGSDPFMTADPSHVIGEFDHHAKQIEASVRLAEAIVYRVWPCDLARNTSGRPKQTSSNSVGVTPWRAMCSIRSWGQTNRSMRMALIVLSL